MIVGEFFFDSGATYERIPIIIFYRRVVSKANRAGTRGFRAPEVLLKCGSQTGGAFSPWFLVIATNDNLNISHRRLVSRRHPTLFCHRQVSYLPIKR